MIRAMTQTPRSLPEPQPADQIGQSLDRLIGTWTAAEADALLTSIEACEQVDLEFWR